MVTLTQLEDMLIEAGAEKLRRYFEYGSGEEYGLSYWISRNKMSDENKKPWDHLRVAAALPPIGPGSWETTGNDTITAGAPRTTHEGARVCFTDGGNETYYTPTELREIGEFLIALADQGGVR